MGGTWYARLSSTRADALGRCRRVPSAFLCALAKQITADSGTLRLISDFENSSCYKNPIHLRTEKLESWQHVTFMACLCERMYPNYAMFCKQTEFGDGQLYRRILDLIWETLTVKDAKVNFDSQLEKAGRGDSVRG